MIQANEGFEPCNCNSTKNIRSGIDNAASYLWDVFCTTDQNLHSYVGIYKEVWIAFKPLQCVYFIYALTAKSL